MQEEFVASNCMVRKAKELVKEKGILSISNPKPGHTLPIETIDIDLAQSFYEYDEVSRMMPGCKDFVSVRKEEGRVHVQKWLILSSLKETYQLFKEKYIQTRELASRNL